MAQGEGEAASTKGHDKAELTARRAGEAVPSAAPHKGVPVHAALCKSNSRGHEHGQVTSESPGKSTG